MNTTIPQSIEDKINKKYPVGTEEKAEWFYNKYLRIAALWGAFELDKWISVKDGLPEHKQKVLVFGNRLGKEVITTARFHKGDEYNDNGWYYNGYGGLDITHYQYLPKPPKDI